jgi:SanA protein
MIRLLLNLIGFCAGIIAIIVVCANLGVYVSSEPYIYDSIDKAPHVQAALVPGAAIYADGSLSPVFLDRVDMAIALYQAQKVSKILVSGDNSTDTYNEVNPAREYLLSKDIPSADIYLDHAGFDTYSTMYRARDIFEVSSILVATQEFHLPRSIFIARMLGVEAHGVAGDVGKVHIRNNVREAFATPKALWDLVTKREPKFLGEEIPITGEEQDVL